MKHRVIHSNNYLLVVDDSEIKKKSDDWFYSFVTKKIYDAKTFYPTVNCKRIIAHLPLNPPFIYGYTNSPILQGVDLLPPLVHPNCCIAKDGSLTNMNKGCAERNRCLPPIEDEVEKLAKEYANGTSDIDVPYTNGLFYGFLEGYKKAKAKYKYTEEDMKKAFEYGKTLEPFDSFDDFIQSLQQPKMPVGFKCETIDEAVRNVGEDINGTNAFRYEPKLKTITNSQGLTQWVGRYIYE